MLQSIREGADEEDAEEVQEAELLAAGARLGKLKNELREIMVS